MLQLKFIGEQNYKPFTYQGKQFRPWYAFANNTKADDLKKYLRKSEITNFNYKDFIEANKKAGNNIVTCLFACNDENIYIPGSQDIILLFDMQQFNKDNEVISEVTEPVPITPRYSILTNNKYVIEMMQLRGSKIVSEGKYQGIVTSERTKLKKVYTPHIKIMGQTHQASQTTPTGNEKIIKFDILDKTAKRSFTVTGIAVTSIPDNKVYGVFTYNKINYFYEVWGDDSGKIVQTVKRKSNAVYVWGGPNG